MNENNQIIPVDEIPSHVNIANLVDKLRVNYKDHQEMVDINEESLTVFNAARWMSLIEALDIIESKAEKLKIDLDNNDCWLAPVPLQHYIDDRTSSMVEEVRFEELT